MIPGIGFIALVAHDWLTARRIHPATLVGGVVYMLYAGPLPSILFGTKVVHALKLTLSHCGCNYSDRDRRDEPIRIRIWRRDFSRFGAIAAQLL
jgi:hypothetical protein